MSDRTRWSCLDVLRLNIPDEVVYFIQAGDVGPIKIGVAGNISKRMAAIQVNNHEQLWLIGYENGSFEDEAHYHERFSKHSLRGEWFLPDPEIVAFAAELAARALQSLDILPPRMRRHALHVDKKMYSAVFNYCLRTLRLDEKERPEYFQRLVTDHDIGNTMQDMFILMNFHFDARIRMNRLSSEFARKNKMRLLVRGWPNRYAYAESHIDPTCEPLINSNGEWISVNNSPKLLSAHRIRESPRDTLNIYSNAYTYRMRGMLAFQNDEMDEKDIRRHMFGSCSTDATDNNAGH